MSKYTLYYFDITGLGEPIRYLLNYCGVQFEDKRLTFEEWPKYKPEMPMGQMPVLDIDGKKLNQSKAICRFLGRKFKLYGKDEFEALEIDATADSVDDMRIAISTWYWEQNEALKPKLKEVADTKMNYAMDKFENQVKRNGGFFVGGKVSWADVHYAALSDYLSNVMGHDFNKDYPALKKLNETIKANPGVKAYLEKRGTTKV